MATLGSKEGFANVAQAITAPGDIIVVPNPTYPIHVFGFLMAGGAIRSVPVETNDAFFGALERAVLFSIPRPIAVVVCYPSNPTACVATLDFYRELVAFAACRLMCLSRSTAPRRWPAMAAPILSTSAWATPICRPRRTSSKN